MCFDGWKGDDCNTRKDEPERVAPVPKTAVEEARKGRLWLGAGELQPSVVPALEES